MIYLGASNLLLLEEAADSLVSSEELHDFPMEFDISRASQAAGCPDEGEGEQLHRVEWIVCAEISLE